MSTNVTAIVDNVIHVTVTIRRGLTIDIPISQGLRGIQGIDGDPGYTPVKGIDYVDGTDGRTLESGTTPPAIGTGKNGDFYIDTLAWKIYGPKTAGAWGEGTAIYNLALFEIDINGDLMPVTEIQDDTIYELDGNGDIMPREA